MVMKRNTCNIIYLKKNKSPESKIYIIIIYIKFTKDTIKNKPH